MRVGLLGTGFWAAEVHARALAAHDRAELVGVWGRDAAKAAVVAERYGVEAVDDVDALLERVDAVAVALPPHVQAPLAQRAAAAGKHLLLDKPLALDVAAADAVVAAAAATGVASGVFFTSRWVPSVASWLDGVAASSWHGASGQWLGSIAGTPFDDSPWRHEHGGLWDVGPHALSVVLAALPPVERVSAARGVGDTTHLLLQHAGGPSSQLALSLTVPAGAATGACDLWGPDGRTSMPERDVEAVDAFSRMVDAVLAQLDGGAPVACDVAFARDVVAVLAAGQASLDAGGGPVDVERGVDVERAVDVERGVDVEVSVDVEVQRS